MNDVIKLLLSHRSIRKFSDQAIDQETINTIVAAGQAAATSSNVQGTTVIQVANPESREKLVEYSGGQKYIASAAAFLVFCADLKRSAQACDSHGGEFTQGMTEHFIIATVDVALFAQNCVIAAESLGMGICYIGGLRNNPNDVSDLLGLPDNVYPVFGLCLGYPEQDPEVKPRLPLEAVLMQESYDASLLEPGITEYDEHIRAYYRSRTGGKKDSNWSVEMKALVGKESRPHMRSFLDAKGFTMK
ncbi:UNVERIFIED_CONTAM: hypothetical protein GTU68_048098 [Idotea baltica]|nr:hypothetical protein [Idotea baltica]